jgi:hypothetical protein
MAELMELVEVSVLEKLEQLGIRVKAFSESRAQAITIPVNIEEIDVIAGIWSTLGLLDDSYATVEGRWVRFWRTGCHHHVGRRDVLVKMSTTRLERIMLVKELHASGMSRVEIARKLGVAASTITFDLSAS